MENILITGGSGLIGTALSRLLVSQGFSVSHLSRSLSANAEFPKFLWDPSKGYIDPFALENAHHIIHLAGTGVADKRWTPARKKEIIASRINGLNLIYKALKKHQFPLQSLISASGINYYGTTTGKTLSENDPNGTDFLSQVCSKWEKAARQFEDICQVSIVRTGLVFSPHGGALQKMSQPIRYGVGAALGNGEQDISWIHLNDLCRIYLHLIQNKLPGVFNATAPNFCTNQELTKELAKVLNRPLFLPNVPAFLLKLLLGEMAAIVLEGNQISSEKIQQTGFRFNYPDLTEALQDLLQKPVR